MTQPTRSGSEPPAPVVKQRRGISIVWAVPIVAGPDRGLPGLSGVHREGPDDHAQLRHGRGAGGGQDQGPLPRCRGRHRADGGDRAGPEAHHRHGRHGPGRRRRICASRPPSGSSSRASGSAACRGSAPCCPGAYIGLAPGDGAAATDVHGPGAAAADRRQRGRPANTG